MNVTDYVIFPGNHTNFTRIASSEFENKIKDLIWDFKIVPYSFITFGTKHLGISDLKEALNSLNLQFPDCVMIVKDYEGYDMGTFSIHRLDRPEIKFSSDTASIEVFLEGLQDE